MNEKLTPCEKLGYKVGDRFEVIAYNGYYKVGEIIILTYDDNTDQPRFSGQSGIWYIGLQNVKKYYEPKEYSYYKKDIAFYDYIDPYRLYTLYGVNRGAVQQCIKKLLAAGQRGAKDYKQDILEARDALNRELEMLEEDNAK